MVEAKWFGCILAFEGLVFLCVLGVERERESERVRDDDGRVV